MPAAQASHQGRHGSRNVASGKGAPPGPKGQQQSQASERTSGAAAGRKGT